MIMEWVKGASVTCFICGVFFFWSNQLKGLVFKVITWFYSQQFDKRWFEKKNKIFKIFGEKKKQIVCWEWRFHQNALAKIVFYWNSIANFFGTKYWPFSLTSVIWEKRLKTLPSFVVIDLMCQIVSLFLLKTKEYTLFSARFLEKNLKVQLSSKKTKFDAVGKLKSNKHQKMCCFSLLSHSCSRHQKLRANDWWWLMVAW